MHFFLGFVLYEGISKIKNIIRIKRDNFNRINANFLFIVSLGLKMNGQVCLFNPYCPGGHRSNYLSRVMCQLSNYKKKCFFFLFFFNIKSIIKTRKLLKYLPSRFSILDILDNSDRLDVAIALKLSSKIMSN